MVLVDVPQGGVLAHGHQPAAEVIVAGHVAGGRVYLVVLIDIEDGLPALDFLDAVAVAIVNEFGGDLAAPGKKADCRDFTWRERTLVSRVNVLAFVLGSVPLYFIRGKAP